MIYAIIKSNYVSARVVGADGYIYPHPHDMQVPDPLGNLHLGDWYESTEQIFYRPINGTPPDWPAHLIPPPQPAQEDGTDS